MYKILYLLLGCLLFSGSSYAQTENDPVYTVVEEMPDYPGGPQELMKFMRSVVLPAVLPDSTVISRLVATVIIEPDGAVSGIEITHLHILPPVDEESEKHIIRRLISGIEKMPAWISGKNNGVPVRVQYTIPLTINYR
ncbi:MAG: hypothetical protein LUG98_13325 [Tannerellaceae bacterium]|nr:hypothetical protein [Tannerellaceae bacterium]